jgi:hypothetical protein
MKPWQKRTKVNFREEWVALHELDQQAVAESCSTMAFRELTGLVCKAFS